MHLPQMVIFSPPKPSLARSRAVFRHLTASKNSSRANPISHDLPETACPGQAFVHAIQEAHFDMLSGKSVCKGASVKIDDNLPTRRTVFLSYKQSTFTNPTDSRAGRDSFMRQNSIIAIFAKTDIFTSLRGRSISYLTKQ